jgi:hypothetical protein
LADRAGFIMVLGARNAGKTLLCNQFSEIKKDTHVSYHLFPPEEGAISIVAFEAALQKATKFKGNTSQIINLLPYNSMIVIHDLELWWERSEENGLNVIRHIKSVVGEYSSKCLFVMNMNPFAYAIVNATEPLDTHCTGVVRCQPFNSHDLKQLVMTRHKSSGMLLDFGNGATNSFSEIKLAKLFNRIFEYSSGNPGVAMNAWLTGIRHFSNETITWKAPRLKYKDALSEMPHLWSHLSLQLLLHKRMSADKIIRLVPLEKDQLLSALDAMQRLQIVFVRGSGAYYLNPAIEYLLIANFREKEWI